MQVLYFQCLLGVQHGVRPETTAYLCQRWAPRAHHHELVMRLLIQTLYSSEIDQVTLIHIRCCLQGTMCHLKQCTCLVSTGQCLCRVTLRRQLKI